MTGATSEKTTQQHTNTNMLKLIVLTLYLFSAPLIQIQNRLMSLFIHFDFLVRDKKEGERVTTAILGVCESAFHL